MQLAPAEKAYQTHTHLDLILTSGRRLGDEMRVLIEGRDSYTEDAETLTVVYRDETGEVVETLRIKQSAIAVFALRTNRVEVDAPVQTHDGDEVADALG